MGHRQRLGVRFKDPGQSGTWGVDNLVGYASKSLGGTQQRSELSWGSYVVTHRFQMSADASFKITRGSDMESHSAEVEVLPKSGQPLASGGMVVVTALSRRQASQKDRRSKLKVEKCRADLLPAVIYRPVQSCLHRWTLIYLHGFGTSVLEEYANTPHFFFNGSIALKVVVPSAPRRELSIFDGWWEQADDCSSARSSRRGKLAVKQFNAWYDYVTNRDGKKEDLIDVDSLHVLREALHDLVRSEAEQLGGQTDRVILGGKSQGCCMALDAALTYPRRLGAFVGVVGHLLACTPVEAKAPQVGMPFHFFHEVEDHLMGWTWVKQGLQKLKSVGHTVYSRRGKDSEGHGHYVNGGFEGRCIRQALESICCTDQ